MDRKKGFIYFGNILCLLIWLSLIGVALWPISGLYGPQADWWGGDAAVRATKYAGWGAVAGMIGMVVQLRVLQKRGKISAKATRRTQIGVILVAGLLTGLCVPYFAIPAQVGLNAQAEFAATWGTDWETRIQVPASGPWLSTPYSLIGLCTPLPYSTSTFTVTPDIEFLNNGVDSFKCDAFIPQGAGPFPVIIDIHGGGWVGGDKDSMMRYQQEYFAAAGYCVFSVQYGANAEANRSRQYSMEEILDNLAAFSNWLAQPAICGQYKANISASFVVGLSAGGHLSALLGVARMNVSAWNPAVRVLGAVDFYGITDLRHWDKVSAAWFNATGLFNASVLADYSLVDRFSPMTYCEVATPSTPNIAPLLVFHGDADSVVSVSQSRDLAAMCAARGLKCVYIEIPRGEHVFEGDPKTGPAQITLWAMERFFLLCRAQA